MAPRACKSFFKRSIPTTPLPTLSLSNRGPSSNLTRPTNYENLPAASPTDIKEMRFNQVVALESLTRNESSVLLNLTGWYNCGFWAPRMLLCLPLWRKLAFGRITGGSVLIAVTSVVLAEPSAFFSYNCITLDISPFNTSASVISCTWWTKRRVSLLSRANRIWETFGI